MVAVTRELARYVVEARLDDLPDRVRHEGERAFVNFIGCALGGSGDRGLSAVLAAFEPFSGPPQASVIGRAKRVDSLLAAQLNCYSSSVHSYNDTHLATVAHPTGPVAAPLLGLAERQAVSGAAFLEALILGIEVQLRVGAILVTPPARCPVGLSSQAVLGVVGAAVAAGKILGLDEQRMVWAIGLATAQASGHRETHATMSSHFVPAHAARCGLAAALLAERGVTSGEQAIEGPKGFASIFAANPNFEAALAGLGEHYEILANTYKPYPCGIVIHPAIDGCLDLAREHDIAADDIERIELTVHPLAVSLTGIRPEPADRMQASVSIHHWAAAALLHRAAGLAQNTEASVHDPAMVALRRRVIALEDAGTAPDAAIVRLHRRDGRVLETRVDHCRGSLGRPMSDAELDEKFRGQAAQSLASDQIEELRAACWSIAEAGSAGDFMRRFFAPA